MTGFQHAIFPLALFIICVSYIFDCMLLYCHQSQLFFYFEQLFYCILLLFIDLTRKPFLLLCKHKTQWVCRFRLARMDNNVYVNTQRRVPVTGSRNRDVNFMDWNI